MTVNVFEIGIEVKIVSSDMVSVGFFTHFRRGSIAVRAGGFVSCMCVCMKSSITTAWRHSFPPRRKSSELC